MEEPSVNENKEPRGRGFTLASDWVESFTSIVRVPMRLISLAAVRSTELCTVALCTIYESNQRLYTSQDFPEIISSGLLSIRTKHMCRKNIKQTV